MGGVFAAGKKAIVKKMGSRPNEGTRCRSAKGRPKPPVWEPPSDTARESLPVSPGNTVTKSQLQRSLSPTTIEGHLSFYVLQSEMIFLNLVSLKNARY